MLLEEEDKDKAGLQGDDKCYEYNVVRYDKRMRAVLGVTGTTTSKAGTSHSYASAGVHNGIPISTVDPDGTRNTVSYDAQQRPVCIVMNDDNDDAGTNPTSCDVPASGRAFWVSFAYSGDPHGTYTVTRRTPGS